MTRNTEALLWLVACLATGVAAYVIGSIPVAVGLSFVGAFCLLRADYAWREGDGL